MSNRPRRPFRYINSCRDVELYGLCTSRTHSPTSRARRMFLSSFITTFERRASHQPRKVHLEGLNKASKSLQQRHQESIRDLSDSQQLSRCASPPPVSAPDCTMEAMKSQIASERSYPSDYMHFHPAAKCDEKADPRATTTPKTALVVITQRRQLALDTEGDEKDWMGVSVIVPIRSCALGFCTGGREEHHDAAPTSTVL